jgi:hypothetical protein
MYVFLCGARSALGDGEAAVCDTQAALSVASSSDLKEGFVTAAGGIHQAVTVRARRALVGDEHWRGPNRPT